MNLKKKKFFNVKNGVFYKLYVKKKKKEIKK
jgi:hypothetical protein